MKKKLIVWLVMLIMMCWTTGAMAVTMPISEIMLPASVDEIPEIDAFQTAPVFTVETVGAHYEISMQWDNGTIWDDVSLFAGSNEGIILLYDQAQEVYKSLDLFENDAVMNLMIYNERTESSGNSNVETINWTIQGTGNRMIRFNVIDDRYDGAETALNVYWDENDGISEYAYTIYKGSLTIYAYYGSDGQMTSCIVNYSKGAGNGSIRMYYDSLGHMTDADYLVDGNRYLYNEILGWFTLEPLEEATDSVPINPNDYPWKARIVMDNIEWGRCEMDGAPIDLNEYAFTVNVGFGT